MVRRSREEFSEWKNETVSVGIDKLLGKNGDKSLIVEFEGSKYFVGQSIVENLDDVLEHLEIDEDERSDELVIDVPRWCAHENGWLDEED